MRNSLILRSLASVIDERGKSSRTMSDFASIVENRPDTETLNHNSIPQSRYDRMELIGKTLEGMGDLGTFLDPEVMYNEWVDGEHTWIQYLEPDTDR